MGDGLLSWRVVCGLLGEEGGEGRVGGRDEERALEAERGVALGVEVIDLAGGSARSVAPVGGEGRTEEVEMKAGIVGDRQRGALVEVGDEVGGAGRLAGILGGAEKAGGGEGGRLAIDPPGGGHAEKGNGAGLGGGGGWLEGE